MSEPLSAVEIEDVLSSIRRLVSEDLRPAPRAAANPSVVIAVHPTVSEAARPALILTPALRVVPDAAPGADAVPDASPVPDDVSVYAEPPAAVPIQEVVASVGAAVEAQGQEWEPETGDAAAAPEPVWADVAWDDAEAPMAEFDEQDAEAWSDPAPGWAQDGGEEAAVMSEADQTATAFAADPDWLAQAEAEVIAGLQQDQRAGTPFEVLEDEPEMSFDEEVLRDLVRDLIREELQGHLGERITRNIRKLVRAEIARALAVQDLT